MSGVNGDDHTMLVTPCPHNESQESYRCKNLSLSLVINFVTDLHTLATAIVGHISTKKQSVTGLQRD